MFFKASIISMTNVSASPIKGVRIYACDACDSETCDFHPKIATLHLCTLEKKQVHHRFLEA